MIHPDKLQQLREACEREYNIDDLHKTCRKTEYTFARHTYHHILKNVYQLTELQISKLDNSRDRSTVYTSIGVADDLLDTDKNFRASYQSVLDMIITEEEILFI